jgi:hypothetical protein
MLERMVNPNKPLLSIEQIKEARNDFEHGDDYMRADVKDKLSKMNEQFLQGRGDLNGWPDEVLEAIDECFIESFIIDGEPADYLFYVNSANAMDKFQEYCSKVAQVLIKNKRKLPKYVLEYFTYFSIWRMQGYAFPVPLMTASVVGSLHTITEKLRKGFIEVSESVAPTAVSISGVTWVFYCHFCISAALEMHLLRGMYPFCSTPRPSCIYCAACIYFLFL